MCGTGTCTLSQGMTVAAQTMKNYLESKFNLNSEAPRTAPLRPTSMWMSQKNCAWPLIPRLNSFYFCFPSPPSSSWSSSHLQAIYPVSYYLSLFYSLFILCFSQEQRCRKKNICVGVLVIEKGKNRMA